MKGITSILLLIMMITLSFVLEVGGRFKTRLVSAP